MPGARASGVRDLEIVIDSHERYPFTFGDRQVTTQRQGLPAGDYGVLEGGNLLASVERKSLPDLVSSLTSGKLKFQLADLAALPRAAVVVEERYSQVFKLDHVRPPLAPAPPTPAEVRAWAVAQGIEVASKGRVSAKVVEAFLAARSDAELRDRPRRG